MKKYLFLLFFVALFMQNLMAHQVCINDSQSISNATVRNGLSKVSNANTVKVGDLVYEINPKTLTASVTFSGEYTEYGIVDNYVGLDEAVVPETIEYDGDTYTVESIGFCAFDSSNISSISFPATLKTIGQTAFAECNNLTELIIPENVSSIDQYAFYLSSNLKSIILPSGLKTISEGTFYGCSSLEKLYIPESVSTIKDFAFHSCSSLNNFVVPEKVTMIPYTCFYGCSSLESIDVKGNISSLGTYAFAECPNLKELNLKGDYTIIPRGVFFNDSSLLTIDLPSSLLEIYEEAFFGCVALNDIYFPESLRAIYDSAFYNCSSLENINLSNNMTALSLSSFNGCKSLTSVIIPSSIEFIGAYAFKDCSNLSNIAFENVENVSTIGVDAFYGTKWFNDQPDGILYLGSIAHTYKGIMPENCFLYIKEGTVSTSEKSFAEQKNLVGISFPNGFKLIGAESFSKCINLKEVSFNNDLEMISKISFMGCTSLETIDLECSEIVELEEGAFGYCIALNDVKFSPNLKILPDNLFYRCTSLTEISLPENLEYLGDYVFEDCLNLSVFNTPSSLQYIGYKCFYNTKWYNEQPDGVIYVNDLVYSYKGWIEENSKVEINDGMKYICYAAFANQEDMTYVSIPKSVIAIGDLVFSGCHGLKRIDCYNPIPPIIQYETFYDLNPKEIELYVPDGSWESYYENPLWKEFDINELDPDEVESIEDNNLNDTITEWYNLDGLRITNPTQGIFIKKENGKIKKVVL